MPGRQTVLKELSNLMSNPNKNNCFGVDYWDEETNEDPFHWQVTLVPPKGTLYEGGFFKLEVKLPDNYPNSVPRVKFLTKIYHCNIGKTDGSICLSTLNKWKNTYTMEDVLNHIMVLLYKQNPDSPMNSEMRELYKNNMSQFEKNAKDWVNLYARVDNFNEPRNQYNTLS